MQRKIFLITCLTILIVGCAVGPDYHRPVAPVPVNYKEAIKNRNFKKHWKKAEPRDNFNRGDWWKIFHSRRLNTLEDMLSISNQTIANAEAQYRNSRALVDEARASFFPTLSTQGSITRQKQGASSLSSSSSSTTSSGSTTTSSTGASTSFLSGRVNSRGPFNSHNLQLNASWEPDIWGAVRRQVEANVAFAQSDYAALAAARLSAQASLAQDYFELRNLDVDQRLLDETVHAYQEALKLTTNRYNAGVAAQGDVVQARSQLETAQAQALNNKINRAQFEHAIAVLIGLAPANFTITPEAIYPKVPHVPLGIPSQLLERRPDVAQQERLMAQANANIGVAITAFYPTLTLTGNGSITHEGFNSWFSLPSAGWMLTGALADQIFDGGLRSATVAAARDTYDATVANYRQTVLTAFQNVEDNLASLLILKQQERALVAAAKDAQLALQIITNQYKAGTVLYTDVITSQNTAFSAQKAADDVKGQELTSAVGLVKALGGGWDAASLELAPVTNG